MFRIAVDVVLLPDQIMTDLTIAANAELVAKYGSEIVLNKNDCLPHMSLAMGCVNREDIFRIGKLLQPLASIAPKRLKLVGVQKSTNFTGEIVSVFQVYCSDSLQDLHEKICEVVKPHFTYDVIDDMIAGGRPSPPHRRRASPSTLQWIRNYPDKSSHSNFSPHITIGYGDLPDRLLPADFAVSHLALCHLGNHCTCVKVLWSTEI
jgi:hypothetical protein